MSFKKQFFLIFTSIFILLIGVLLTFYNILKNEKEIAKAELKRYESYLLADELRQSSDDLTRMARTYTVTGDPLFRKYFNQILDIRDGKIPRPQNYSGIYWDFVTGSGVYPSSPSDEQVSLESLMKEKEFSKDEFNLLRIAKNKSDTLVKMENRAMNAMIGLYPDEKGDFIIRKEPDALLAQKIMHSPEYHRVKKDIMKPMQDFFQKVDQRTFETVSFYRKKGLRLNSVMLSLVSLSLLLVFISFCLLFLQRLQKKEKVSSSGSKRYFFLYRSWPLLILLAAASAIQISFSLWNTKTMQENIEADISSQLSAIVETTYESTIQWLEEAEQELRSLVLFHNLSEKDSSLSNPELSILKVKLDSLIKLNQYENYFLLDEESHIISSSRVQSTGKKFELAPAILSQLKGPKKTALLFPSKNKLNLSGLKSTDLSKENSNKISVNESILLTAPLTDKNLLVLELPLNGSFSQVVQKGRFKKSGESYVFNEEAYLLSESRFNDQLYEMGFLKKGQNSSLNIRVYDPKTKAATQMISSSFKRSRGVNLKPYNDYRGIPVIGSWIWNSEYKIGFSTEIDANEAFESLNLFKTHSYTQLIISLFLLLVLTGIFIWNRILISEANLKLSSAYKEIQTYSSKMEEELKVGRQVQMSMVPSSFPKEDRFSIFASLKPVRQLGGDFYDFFFLDQDSLCLVIGDVSGKGVPSALFMAVAKTLIRSSSFKYGKTDKIISEVNKNILLNNPHCMFATLFIAVLNLKTGVCEYSSAGHHSSYIKKKTGHLLILDQTHGPVTGAVEDTVFTKDEILLEQGDFLIAYTDGITESVNPQNQLYGEEKLENLLKQNSFKSPKEMIAMILKNVEDFSKTNSQSDDITLIAFKYKSLT